MIARRLGAYAAQAASAPLSAEVSHAARRCLIDWFAAALPGAACAPATLLADALADELSAGGRAQLLPSGKRAPARAAALINGTASHTVEFDDIYRDALYHPGAPVIAAAIAAAQTAGASGKTLLAAIVSGYEISNRIGEVMVPSHYEFWHTTGTVGALGAAAGAATALGLDGAQSANAIANSASFAAGLQQAFRSDAMTKPQHAGRAAETGLLCALGAARGVTGAADMIEGPRGFGAAMSTHADFEHVADDLGERFTITRTTQKNHGCCGHSFAALDGIIALKNEHDLDGADIEWIEIGTYAKAVEIVGNPEPATPYEAKFSLPYCAAAAAITGKVRLASFANAQLEDERLRALMSRVRVHVDDACEAAFPGRRSARIAMSLRDGRRLHHHAPTRKGDPENPLDDEEIEDKYRELATPVLGEDVSAELLEALWRIEDASSLEHLIAR